jgi:hypothetical protein
VWLGLGVEGVIYLRPVGQFGLTKLMGWLDQFGLAEFLVKTHDKDICLKNISNAFNWFDLTNQFINVPKFNMSTICCM